MEKMKIYGIVTYESTRKADIVRECKKRGIATKEEVNAIIEDIRTGKIVFDVIAHGGKIYVLTLEHREYVLMYR